MTTLLRQTFEEQAGHCDGLDSPFMGRLLRLLAAHWPRGTQLAATCDTFDGDIGPIGTSLPLRIAGGLHALVLQRKDHDLTAAYPPNPSTDAQLWQAVNAALHQHDTFLCNWIKQAPQTNEVRRAAALIPAAHMLAKKYALPLRLSELGASGGLNLMFDHFNLQAPVAYGPKSAVQLTPDWQGSAPSTASLEIVERRGVDLNPLDSSNAQDRLRLQAYLWPDQPERLSRTRAAIKLQNAPVQKGDAIDWLTTRLPHISSQLHLVYHTIAWQYFPPDHQARGAALIKAAGKTATKTTPLAWLSMEADGASPGAALRLRLWPDDIDVLLARVDFHGRWLNWLGPTQLP